MTSLRLVVAYLFIQLNHFQCLLQGKDEDGKWWPVTIISEHDNDTVSCVVHDEVDTIWSVVHRENLRWSIDDAEDSKLQSENRHFEVAEQPSIEWWRYNPCNGKPVSIREAADFRARRTSSVLQPGEVFQVDGKHFDAEGILQLRLADGRGWLFDRIPGGCTICRPAEGHQPQWWRYTPFNGKRVSVREGADVKSPRTNKVLQPGDVFQVDGTILDKDGTLHLRLADGSGWLFDRTPDGVLCSFIDDNSY